MPWELQCEPGVCLRARTSVYVCVRARVCLCVRLRLCVRAYFHVLA